MAEDDCQELNISRTASEIKRLKTATINAARERERLPQPLFWSLFHSELDKVRVSKEKERLISSLLEA